jgi:hypothetical protein
MTLQQDRTEIKILRSAPLCDMHTQHYPEYGTSNLQRLGF